MLKIPVNVLGWLSARIVRNSISYYTRSSGLLNSLPAFSTIQTCPFQNSAKLFVDLKNEN